MTLRVVGGWVRDKLLKQDSNDIDIAMEGMPITEFAQLIDERANAEALAADPNHKYVKAWGMRPASEERLKCLDVVNLMLHGQEIDLVNIYQDDNGVSSPLEDALRRDCTINALFYNINDSRVEDWSGKGLEDLANGLIRTPIDPVKTFTSDPIKSIRVFRFADRFNFRLDASIYEAVARKDIHALMKRQDAWIKKRELEKISFGRQPEITFAEMLKAGLYNYVNNIP